MPNLKMPLKNPKSSAEAECLNSSRWNPLKQKGALVGKSPAATKLMLLTVCVAAAHTRSQTSFRDSIVFYKLAFICVSVTEKEVWGIRMKHSSSSFLLSWLHGL